jgi:hypothetical protein
VSTPRRAPERHNLPLYERVDSHLDGLHPDIDLRHDGLTVRLLTMTPDYCGMTRRDVELARQISAKARDHAYFCCIMHDCTGFQRRRSKDGRSRFDHRPRARPEYCNTRSYW